MGEARLELDRTETLMQALACASSSSAGRTIAAAAGAKKQRKEKTKEGHAVCEKDV